MAGHTEVLRALAAITGQTLSDAEAAFHELESVCTDQRRADDDEVRNFFARLKTRLGLAPAVDSAQATDLRQELDSVTPRTS